MKKDQKKMTNPVKPSKPTGLGSGKLHEAADAIKKRKEEQARIARELAK